MTSSFKVASIFGFDIRIHWSWVFIFLLITWTFSAGILEELFPEWATATRWATGASVAVVFFLSILFHEVSHSVVARHYGIPISSITLFIFGGVSNLGRESESPRQEFFVAIVGPATSLVFAAGFGIAAFLIDPVSGGVATILANLGAINLAIAIFNMVPGYPLDGGRVLRSAIWARKKDVKEATRLASQVGNVVAFGIMGVGVLFFFLVSVISGIWLFLIGNFLRIAAEASYRQLVLNSVLSGAEVGRLRLTNPRTVDQDTRVRELVNDYILTGQESVFPVVRNGEMLGVVSAEQARNLPREHWSSTTVGELMTSDGEIPVVSPEQDLSEAMKLMADKGIDQVLVAEDNKPRGLLFTSDIMHFVQANEQFQTSEPELQRAA